MDSIVATVTLAIVAFASTNMDDLFMLVAFLVDKHFNGREVVIGQYAGMGVLFSLSAVVARISLIIPATYLGLLGLVPIAIGTKKLWNLHRGKEPGNLQSVSNRRVHRTLTVAAVTIANGGDNIAVYTAILATHNSTDLSLIAIVFTIMTGLWCLAAHWFINHRALGAPIRYHAHRLVPFVLIGLGLLIIIRTGLPAGE